MSSYAVLLGILTINVLVGYFGSKQGYTVNGVVQGGEYITDNPGLFGVVEWVWESLGFLWNMLTFSVDGIPALISWAFVVMQVMLLWLVVQLIRGNEG